MRQKRERFDRLAEMGCCLCRRLGAPGAPAEVHHLRAGAGAGQRSDYTRTIPLCPRHHRGQDGLHGLGTRGFEAYWGVDEEQLLAEVNAALGSV